MQCLSCDLVFVPQAFHLCRSAEKAEYDKHQNTPEDVGYRRFLSQLAVPLLHRLEPGSSGLDFGSGPGPTLSLLFEEAGHHCALYDPFYADDPSVFSATYDFIVLSEVAEHLCCPGRELTRLWQCLKPGGWMGVMTQMVSSQDAFKHWRYTQDATHISFFSKATFEFLAKHCPFRLEWPGGPVVLGQKTAC